MSKVKQTTVGRIRDDVLAYTAGDDAILDLALVEVDCIGTAAHATMLSRMPLKPRVLSPRDCARVIDALVAIIRRARRGQFEIRVEDQDVHMAVERVLTKRLGGIGKRIHTARSRNDQAAVDLRLYAKEKLFGLTDATIAVATELLKFARRHAAQPMVGRTHMQPAMPSSVGLWAAAHVESLVEDLALLDGAYVMNDQSPLGAAAGFGVPLPIDRKLTAALLGFDRPIGNVLYAINSRSKCEAVILNAASQVMWTLSRLAQDLMLYSMPEFGYFIFPEAYGTGSSIMPQKCNPDVCELVRARAARVQSAADGAAQIGRGLPSGYNRDAQESKELLMQGLRMTEASLQIWPNLIRGTRVDRAALRRGFTPAVFATDRALELVGQGMPFRDAYTHVKTHLEELQAQDPAQAIARKTHIGAPAGLDFAELQARLRAVRRCNNRRRAKYGRAISKLLGIDYPDLKA